MIEVHQVERIALANVAELGYTVTRMCRNMHQEASIHREEILAVGEAICKLCSAVHGM